MAGWRYEILCAVSRVLRGGARRWWRWGRRGMAQSDNNRGNRDLCGISELAEKWRRVLRSLQNYESSLSIHQQLNQYIGMGIFITCRIFL